MKTFNRIASVLILSVGVAGLNFAAGAPEPYSLVTTVSGIPDQTTIGYVEVPVTQEIRDWFSSVKYAAQSWTNAKGDKIAAGKLDGSKIDAPLTSLTTAYKDSIDAVFYDSDLRAELTALVNPVLKAALVRGEVEKASMRIGRHTITMSISGPEDN